MNKKEYETGRDKNFRILIKSFISLVETIRNDYERNDPEREFGDMLDVAIKVYFKRNKIE